MSEQNQNSEHRDPIGQPGVDGRAYIKNEKEQVTIRDIREAMKIARKVTPIMTNGEYTKLMLFYASVVNRYAKEHYPNGLPEEDETSE